MRLNKICVVGLGYIGLPTATLLATKGKRVLGLEIDHSVVNTINSGQVHIVEPGLDSMVKDAIESGMLKATTKAEEADAFIITVPTPIKGKKHQPDLSYIEAACRTISRVLRRGNLVVLESTSPVGTLDKVSGWLSDQRSDLTFAKADNDSADIFLAYCPERVIPGKVLEELVENDRVIGGVNVNSTRLAESLYQTFVKGECIHSNSRTAEMVKLVENSFRDVNIAFANEISILCDRYDIDVWELIELANRHPRVDILKPGIGVGGHCIAVDPWFLVSEAPEETELIRSSRSVNDAKPLWVANKIVELMEDGEDLRRDNDNRVFDIACFGLAYKPDIGDLRESPSIRVIETLVVDHKKRVAVVEPYIDELPSDLVGLVQLVSMDDALRNSHVVALLVNHSEFLRIHSRAGDHTFYDFCGTFGSL